MSKYSPNDPNYPVDPSEGPADERNLTYGDDDRVYRHQPDAGDTVTFTLTSTTSYWGHANAAISVSFPDSYSKPPMSLLDFVTEQSPPYLQANAGSAAESMKTWLTDEKGLSEGTALHMGKGEFCAKLFEVNN